MYICVWSLINRLPKPLLHTRQKNYTMYAVIVRPPTYVCVPMYVCMYVCMYVPMCMSTNLTVSILGIS